MNKKELLSFIDELIDAGHESWEELGIGDREECLKLYVKTCVHPEDLISEVVYAIEEGSLSESFIVDCRHEVKRIIECRFDEMLQAELDERRENGITDKFNIDKYDNPKQYYDSPKREFSCAIEPIIYTDKHGI